MSNPIVERVANRWASIVLREDPTSWIVSGTYQELSGILKTLKARGFRWDPSRRVWWIPKEKLTERQLTNLRKLLEAPQAEANKNAQKREEIFSRASQLHMTGLRFELERNGTAVSLKGSKTYDVKDLARAARGSWSASSGWMFDADTDLAQFEKLVDRCETLSKVWTKQVDDIKEYLVKPRTWPALNVTLALDDREVVVSGNTKPIKDSIKHFLPQVHFESVRWKVYLTKTTLKELEALAKDLDEEEAKAATEAAPPKPQQREQKRPNRKADYCIHCGGWVLPGAGYLIWYYSSEEGDFVWKVEHQDPKDCEEVRAAAKIRQEKARTKAQAHRSLREIATKPEHFVQGQGHRPQGTTVYLNSKTIGYGGGEWVVIEPGEQHMWYVINNGADGDDWSSNNVQTGGAGAIGYRLPYTEEIKVLLDVAREDQKD